MYKIFSVILLLQCLLPASNMYAQSLIPGSIMLTGLGDVCAGAIPHSIHSRRDASGGNGSYTYQWQTASYPVENEMSWANIAEATATSYQPPGLYSATCFRRQVTSGGAVSYTTSLCLYLTECPLEPGVVTAQPPMYIPENTSPNSFTLLGAQGGMGTYSYQWQSKVAEDYFTDIPGATASTYQAPPLSITTTYRCRVQSGSQTAVTNSIVVNLWQSVTDCQASSSINYIIRCYPLETGSLSEEERLRASVVQYYDGLGRPIQTVLPLHTPEGNDLVSSIAYDSLGRESKHYLSVPVEGSCGAYIIPTILDAVRQNFYGAEAPRAFAETIYEPSPLNRVTQQVMPGINWENNPVQYAYSGNTATVASWHYNDAGTFTPVTYAVGSLFVNTVTDPDGRPAREYKDKLGMVVMTEAYDGAQWLQVRYVYDDFGQRKAIVPPQATSVNDVEYCYYYEHDYRRRVIRKKIPGADWIDNVYDLRDRLVYTQDGNNRNNSEWKRINYDDFNRETGTELCMKLKSPYNRQYLQDAVNANAVISFTTVTPLYQTCYDNYAALDVLEEASLLQFVPNEVSGSACALNNKGRITIKTATSSPSDMLSSGTPPFIIPIPVASFTTLITVYYYDTYGRVIQTVATNHIGGIDRVSTQYDFRGNVLQTLQESDWINEMDDPGSLTLRQTIDYDLVKRPTAMHLKINDEPLQTIAEMEYDELGRVKTKKLHDELETIIYEYNIQNWVKTIISELFEQKLYYEQAPTGSNVTPQFGGNISGMSWQTNLQTPKRYAFTYDGVNRLLTSQYSDNGGAFNNNFTEHLTYDKNGNITTLKRYGVSSLLNDLTYTYNGNQVTQITDAATGAGLPINPAGYTYDLNGNTKTEGNTTTAYNLLNLPYLVDLIGGRKIYNTYAADGRKLRTEVDENGQLSIEGCKIYNDNLVFDINGDLSYILFPEGRILHDAGSFTYEYHLKDHLGSTRVAFTPTSSGANVVQVNAFYPFGAPIAALSWSNQTQNKNRYLREGKEYVSDHDWNKYDYHARAFCSWSIHSLQIDPMAEKFYHLSPYALWGNNPLRNIDPDGRWFFSVMHPKIVNHGTKEMARNAANIALTIVALGQGLAAGPIYGNKPLPDWCIPMQLNENWEIEQKLSWTRETLSWEDGKEIMKNTLGALLFFIPILQEANFLENQLISSSISTIVDMTNSSSSSTDTPSASTAISPQQETNVDQSTLDENNQLLWFDFFKPFQPSPVPESILNPNRDND
ncbi:MAG: DUF6443 domain-containing protein [Bacteroidales bacterium]|nr:DUF6443 domain-containing protein [Bacteroidales bacterium]MCL2133421.1 DUF6443 domain-containing protein [Bacteroidales bacterium]